MCSVRSVNDHASPNLRDDLIASPEVIASLRDRNFKVEDHASTIAAEDSTSISSSSRCVSAVDP